MPEPCAVYDRNRGTGITTRQIKEAPLNAIFVWCNQELTYPAALASRLGRQDLKIVAPSTVLAPGFWDGRSGPIVVDHAFYHVRGFKDVCYLEERLRELQTCRFAQVAEG